MDTIRTSMRNGESLVQAAARINGGIVDGVTVPGIMKTTKARASALAATSMNAVANEAALKSFQANNDVIKAVTQVSTLDNKTSDICVAYSGQTWDINTLAPVMGGSLPFNGGPPRHFNCRSRLRPVTMSFKELGIDKDEIPAGTRASMDGQVPSDVTFNQFLRGKSKGFQDDLLGPSRARLWRNGDINLTQLVDMRGNPMSLAQLEQKLGIKPPPRVVAPPKPPGPKLVESFLDDVLITEAERAEITAHAKRLVALAEDADVVVTKQIKSLAKDVKAKFPDAPIVKDGPDVVEGSLHWRLKEVDSTQVKIQKYARDRNLTFTEASEQISDSLRYTYIVDEDDYIKAVQEIMEEFAELGYKNGKFDPAWLLRDDYKGLNINMVSPQGVRMELQVHTARSFRVKNGINHDLYKKFEKLSKAKQAGPEGQALQAEMLANAQAIPVPKNIQFLDDLAKTYNKPTPEKQRLILDLGEQRAKARELEKKRLARQASEKKKREAQKARKTATQEPRPGESEFEFTSQTGTGKWFDPSKGKLLDPDTFDTVGDLRFAYDTGDKRWVVWKIDDAGQAISGQKVARIHLKKNLTPFIKENARKPIRRTGPKAVDEFSVDDQIKSAKKGEFQKPGETQAVIDANVRAYAEAPDYMKAAIGRRRALNGIVEEYELGNNGGAFYRHHSNEIWQHRATHPNQIGWDATWRHEYGHAVDFDLAERYYRLAGTPVQTDRWGVPIISAKFNKSLLADNKVFQKWQSTKFRNRSKPDAPNLGLIYDRAVTEHATKSFEIGRAKYYDPLLKKHGMTYQQIKDLAKRNFDLQGRKLDDYVDDILLPNLLASVETGNVQGFLTAATQHHHIGGGDLASFSDYIGSITKNKIRGRWGHDNAYYGARQHGRTGKHKEAFANFFGMMGGPDGEFFDTILRAWGANKYLDDLIDAMKLLEKG